MSARFSLPQQGDIQQIAHSFQRATGLPMHFHPPGAYHVPEDALIPPFCRLLAQSSRSCESCRAAHLSLQDSMGRETRSAVCFAGLTSSAVPVRTGNTLLGFLHTGHANVEAAACCEAPGQNCRFLGTGKRREKPACAGACRKTPRIARERYEGAVELLGHLASHIAEASTVELPGGTYPAINRAVEMLRADITQDWKLSDIARQVGMHPGYFSERFHQHMGVNFIHFVAGLRIERACHLLEFTTLPVSDVAFACGFRSLSQFNRTFKKITGQAPGKMFHRPHQSRGCL